MSFTANMMAHLKQSPLYRKHIAAVICVALVLAGTVFTYAQRKHSHQLRAIALVELYGPKTAKPTGGRVLPIAILVGEKWYDAATYNATPRPLALDFGTVYEALDNGEPTGYFTVAAARQVRGDWFGVGKWQSRHEVEAAEAARAAAQREKTRTLADDGPPKIRKPKPGETGPAPRRAEDKPLVVPETAQPARPAPGTSSPRTDPDRPTLRRGGGNDANTYAKETLEPPAGVLGGSNPPAHRTLIAVSDPDGTGETRNFGFPWKPEEERALKAKAVALAEAEVAKYRAGRFGAATSQPPPKKSAKRTAKTTAPAVRLENVHVAGYDLGLDNNAQLVVTATSGDVFVTLVARTDLQFTPQKVFAVVTDKEHLDAIPRMELVGAVDADAKGKGELLFRLIGDGTYRYALYRVGRDSMTELWRSGRYER